MDDRERIQNELLEEINSLKRSIDGLEKIGSQYMKVDEKLEESESRLSRVLEAIQEGITFSDEKGNFYIYNPAMEQLTGYTMEEANAAADFITLLYPDPQDRDNALKGVEELLATKKSREIEAMICTKAGELKNVLIYSSIVPYEQANLFLSVYRDITERKKTEQILKIKEQRYRLVAKNISDVVWTMDLNLHFQFFSPSVERILGYTYEEALTLRLDQLLMPDSYALALRTVVEEMSLEEKREQQDPYRSRTLQLEEIRKDGSTHWAEVNASFLRDADGRATGILGVSRDITERKKTEIELRQAYDKLKNAQAQLIQAEKMEAVGTMASGVAHEVKNPLAIILQCINFLESKYSGPRKNIQEVINMAKENISRADRIIRALIDFSRLTELEIKKDNISSILENSLNLIGPEAKQENIEIVKDLNPKLPLVLADKMKMEQVFINIILNAIQAMPAGGKLYLRSYRATEASCKDYNQYVIVEIEDTGNGIPESNLDKIFDPFFTTKGAKGSGLGLAVSRSIIEMLEGFINIKSRVNHGTKITIGLKVAKGE
ncbi:MAG: PAS domain S-box protein [Candidatus Omnitrophica bacterium]|nr:PAS domain S-box protein [Candidatus Omnitrophota bacterium]